MKRQPDREPESADLETEDAALFGFADSSTAWFDRARKAVAPEPLGSIGEYEILDEVSRGGQGIVYRARQPGTGRLIALKRLLAGSFSTKLDRRRFEREIEAASSLRHPGIVTIYGVDFASGSPSLAMEWIDGATVTEWARGTPRPETRAMLRMFLRVADAVHHAHQHGVVHRDLKPSNILVDRAEQPRLLDFGLAVSAGEADDGRPATRTGGFVGTPAYAPPEQLDAGGERVDVRGDVYSLGVILYEMLTGERPLRPELGVRAYLDALDRDSVVPPSSHVPGLGREIDAIVLKALRRDPVDRYQAVSPFAADVRCWLAGEPVSAHPPTRWYLLKKAVARHRAVVSLVGLLAVSLIVGLAIALFQASVIADERDAQIRARETADRQRDRAEFEAESVTAILDFVVGDILENATPAAQGGPVDLAAVVDAAAENVAERFGERPKIEARIRLALARSYFALGRYDAAESQLVRSAGLLDVEATEPSSSRAEVERFLGLNDLARMRSREAAEHLHRALEMTRANRLV